MIAVIAKTYDDYTAFCTEKSLPCRNDFYCFVRTPCTILGGITEIVVLDGATDRHDYVQLHNNAVNALLK